jgi:hypothetical protein
LTKDADVGRWYDNVLRGSLVTADVYMRRLGSFCRSFDINPAGLVSLSESELHNLLLDCVSSSVLGRLMAEMGKMKTYSDAIEAMLNKSVILSPESS